MLLDGLISLLKADAGVSAIASTRVYDNVLPRGYVLPAVVVHRYGGIQDYDFAGPVEIREDQVQVDTYADTAATGQTLAEAVRTLLAPYVGMLPDGTVVQACFLERDMDMPFLPNANVKGIANRSSLGFRVITGGTLTSPLVIEKSAWHAPVESPDGVRVTFTFIGLPASKDKYFLVWGGLLQAPDSFTQNGNQITVSPAPTSGTALLTYF